MNLQKFVVDPMKEGHPEAFTEPQTIPAGWNVSDMYTPTQQYAWDQTAEHQHSDGQTHYRKGETR